MPSQDPAALRERGETIARLARDDPDALAAFFAPDLSDDRPRAGGRRWTRRRRPRALENLREAFRQGADAYVEDHTINGSDWGHLLPRLTRPTRIWQGDDDNNVPAEATRWLAERIPGAELTIVTGAGHGLTDETWPEVYGWLSFDRVKEPDDGRHRLVIRHRARAGAATVESGDRSAGRLRPQPALLHAGGRRARRTGCLPHRLAHLEQPPGRDGPRRRGAGRAGAAGLRRVPAVPHRPRPQLHPAVALGADPFAGRRRRLPPQHDAAALGAHRTGRGQGRPAAVRPRAVGARLLRSAAVAGDRRRRSRHLRRRHALRRLGASPQPCPGPHRGPPVPRPQQRERHRGDVDRRPAGTAARPAHRAAAGDVHPPGGRRPARPAERALGSGQRVLRRRFGDPRSSPSSSAWIGCRAGATPRPGSTG